MLEVHQVSLVMPVPKVLQVFKDPQGLQEFQASLAVKVNQDLLVKSSAR